MGDITPLHTALREANEEIRLLFGPRKTRVPIEADWLRQIGKAHQFRVHTFTTLDDKPFNNNERSTLFVLTIPPHSALRIEVLDEDASGQHFIEIDYEVHRFQTLVEEYKQKPNGPNTFADGAGRVLKAYIRSAKVRRAMGRYVV